MVLKNKFIPIILVLTTIIVLTTCEKKEQNKDIPTIKNKTIENQITKLSIDTFSTFPPEIDGCTCYFSNDSIEFKEEKYIYMNDFAETAFLKINGKLIKFTQIDFKEIDSLNTIAKYKSKSFDMTIEVKDGKQNGDETYLKTGKIELTNHQHKTITKTFYGECGC